MTSYNDEDENIMATPVRSPQMTDEGNITDADLLEQAAELAELLSDSRRCQFCGGDPYHYEDVGVAFPVPVAVVCCELGIAIHSKEPDDGLVRASGNLHQAGWLLSQAVRIAHDALASRVHPAGEPVARAGFPILRSGGQTIDWQLVADHGKQAQANHYQTVKRLAERGGLAWTELCAVLLNRPYQSMDENEAMITCRALEARYLEALTPGSPL